MSAVVDIFSGASLEKNAAAHALVEMGLRVFPLVPGTKRPLVKRFYEVATTDRQQIDIWWPPGSENNIGIATDDLLVVDIDCKGGRDGMATYLELGLPLDTRIARTASGSWHAILRGPPKACSVGKLGPGLDTRGVHGYIVGVGSTIDGKAYAWDNDAPILPAPPELVAKLDDPRERSDITLDATELNTDAAVARVIKFLETEAGKAIQGQGGNLATYKLANACMDKGVCADMAFELMLDHWNETKAFPRWDEDELQKIVENARSYRLSPLGGQTPEADLHGVADIPAPIYREGTLAARRGTRRQFKRLGDPSLIVGPEWLLKPWLPRSGVVLLAGQSQIGKSFLAIDLAAALANGSQWFGHTPRDMVGSLYVAAEGEQTIGGRLEAVRLTRLNGMAQASVPIFPDNLDDVERPDDPRVRVNELLEHFAHAITSARDTMAEEGLPPLGVVFIDTLGDAFQVDDNDTSTVKALMSGLGKLARRLAILIVGITHFGKDDRAGVAGTYNWKAGADVVLAATGEVNEVAGTVKRRQLVLNKSRYVETGFISAFDLTVVDIGLDPDGTPAKAAAITATTAKPKAEKPSPHSDLLKECLDLALVDHAIEIDGYQVAPRYEVMKWFRERKPGSKDSGNVSRAFAWAERWADVKLFTRDGIEYLGEGRWPVLPE